MPAPTSQPLLAAHSPLTTVARDRSGKALVLSLVVLLLAAAAGVAVWWFLLRGPAGADRLASEYLPADVDLVVAAELDELRKTDAWKALSPAIDAYTAAAGVKPLMDATGIGVDTLDHVAFGLALATPGDGGAPPTDLGLIAIGEGALNRGKINGALAELVQGGGPTDLGDLQVVATPGADLALIGERTVSFGTTGLVGKGIDVSKGKAQGPLEDPKLAGVLTMVNRHATFWGASTIQMPDLPFGMPTFRYAAGHANVSNDKGLEWLTAIQVDTPEEALRMKSVANQGLALAKLGAGAFGGPVLGAVLDKIVLGVEGDIVRVNMQLSPKLTVKLAGLAAEWLSESAGPPKTAPSGDAEAQGDAE